MKMVQIPVRRCVQVLFLVSFKTLALYRCDRYGSFIGISLAKFTGNWHNEISKQEYLSHVTSANHKLNSFDRIDPEKMQKMIIMMKQLKEQQMRTQNVQENKGE